MFCVDKLGKLLEELVNLFSSSITAIRPDRKFSGTGLVRKNPINPNYKWALNIKAGEPDKNLHIAAITDLSEKGRIGSLCPSGSSKRERDKNNGQVRPKNQQKSLNLIPLRGPFGSGHATL